MLHRMLRVVVLVALLAETGCVKRVPVDVYPIHRASDRVKPRDKVTAVLEENTLVRGYAGADSSSGRPVEWKTREITGRLVTWDERTIVIRVADWRPGEEATFEIPLARLEQVDRWPGLKPGPAMTAVLGVVVVVGVAVLIIAALSKPG